MITRKNFLIGAAATAATASAIDGASVEGSWGRARGLLGGAFMGVMLAQQGGTPLPYDHAVEYLGTDGNQYIQPFGITNVTMGTTYRVRFDFQFTGAAMLTYYGIGVTSNAQQCFIALSSANGVYACVAHNTEDGRIVRNLGGNLVRHVFEAVSSDGSLTYDYDDERIYTGTTSSFVINRLTLFALGTISSTAISRGSMRIYGASFRSGDGHSFDMIPVRKDGVGYMFDRVSGQLFANKGTGSFAVGPDA